jgi:zinc transporter ZupT
MRIAKPILAITTPVGVAVGLYEAWRFGPHLAVLMAIMMAVVAGFVLYTVRRIRAEQRTDDASRE